MVASEGHREEKNTPQSEEGWNEQSEIESVSHSVVSDFFPPTLTVARQAPLSMGFSRQGYWSGLPFPSPGDLPNPDIEPGSSALQVDSLPLSHQGSPE